LILQKLPHFELIRNNTSKIKENKYFAGQTGWFAELSAEIEKVMQGVTK